MDKEQKQAAVKEIGEALESSKAVFAVDYRGISVPQAAELRTKLREADASFTVVKNRLAKRVTADSGSESLDEHLTGPTALTYVKGDPVIAAKAISDFIREHETISYKGGIMEGKPLDPDEFKVISRLPGVDVLRGQLTGLVATPITGLVRGLNGLIQGLATQLGQIAEQGLVTGEAPAEEPAEPAAEEAPAEEPAEPAAEDAPSEDASAEDAPVDDDSTDEPPAEEADDDDSTGDAPADDAPADDDAPAEEASADGDDDEPEAPAVDEPAGSDEPAADAEPVTEADADEPETSEQSEETEQGEETGDADDADAADNSEADETKED
jgi:large subunit ribosomal protein L10